MEWSDLRANWQQKNIDIKVEAQRPAVTQRLWHSVKQRDALETAVAVITASVFGVTAVGLGQGGQWVAAAFALFLVAALAGIVLRLRHARRRIPKPDPEQSVLDFLRAEQRAIVAQSKMLSSTFIWYWGPIAFGVIGFFTSLNGLAAVSLAYAIVVIGMGIGIEIANRRVVTRQLEPALRWLSDQISSLEENQ